ncbi:MAG: UDP-glucose--hexose-1-phosphate uridylyltransferase [Actinomycetes bacterium]
MISTQVERLLLYGVRSGLIVDADVRYVRNRILEVLRIEQYDASGRSEPTGSAGSIDDLLRPLLDDAAARQLITPDTTVQRDLWDTAIMGCFVDPPARLAADFQATWSSDPTAATDRFHAINIASNYIRVTRTDRNITWSQHTTYGPFEMTINVSKPEKDPRDIAAAAHAPVAHGYPLCLLCPQNEGFAGNSHHPARQNLRLIPMVLTGEQWFFQYSPYRYYNEHCIVLSAEHRPMKIDHGTFVRLAEFTALLPHYLIGSNADIPIVGGSILSHDHFQGGCHTFPMDNAAVLASWAHGDVTVQVLHWPLAVIRLTGPSAEVIAAASQILDLWRGYDDPAQGVVAFTEGVPHNSITPIARALPDGELRLDLVLRNNRTSPQHPDGIFHPHAEIHPIKRENIGLIEVLGLAVLPGRLATDLDHVARALADGSDLTGELSVHQPMLDELRSGAPVADFADARVRVKTAAGDFFVRGLEHCGVFGADPVAGVSRFLGQVGWPGVPRTFPAAHMPLNAAESDQGKPR